MPQGNRRSHPHDLVPSPDHEVVSPHPDAGPERAEAGGTTSHLNDLAESLACALDMLHAGVWDLDLINHSAFRSLGHDRIFGYDELLPEWTYEMFLEHVLPEDRAGVDSKFRGAQETQADWSFECRIRRADGDVRWIAATGRHRTGTDGVARRMAGVVQDITGRKQSELELDQTRAMYQALVETTTDFIWETDADARYTYCSPQMKTLWGLEPQEMIGKTPFDVMSDEEKAKTARVFVELLHSPRAFSLESVAFNAAGELIRTETKGVPFFDSSGRLAGFRGVTRDVTARSHVEEELRQAKRETEDLIRYAPTAIYEVDVRGQRFLGVNDAMCEMSGYTRDELLAMSPFDLLDEPSREIFRARIAEALGGGDVPTDVEYRALAKDGTEKFVMLRARMISDADGQPRGAFVIAHDITEVRRAQNDLRASEARLRLLSETNSLLLSSQEPVAVIEGIAEKVMRHLDCDVSFNYLVDDSDGGLFLNAYLGIPENVAGEIARLDTGTTVCGCVAQTGRRIVSEDVQTNGDSRATLVRSMGIQAYACHPLRNGEDTIGTLSFGSRSKTTFSEDEIELMRTVADQVSVAIERARAEEAIRAGEARFRSVLDSSSDVLYRVNVQTGKIEYISPMSTEVLGYTPKELESLGAEAFASVVYPDDLPAVQAAVARLESRGHATVEYRFRRPGPDRWFANNMTLIRDEFGRPLYRDGSVRDITSRKRAEAALTQNRAALEKELARTTVLRELASAVASSLDSRELARRALSSIQRLLGADGGAVYVLGGDPEQLSVMARLGGRADGPPSSDAAPDATTLAGQALLTGKAQIAIAEPAAADLPAGRGTARVARTDHRHIAFPIGPRGSVTGVVELVFPGARPFEDDELELYRAAADQLSVGFQRARRYDAEHDIAEKLQEMLVVLPSRIPGVAFSRAYESATLQLGRVGGDFVDVFGVQKHLVGVALGDVAGKGVDAAVITSLVRATLRAHALDGLPPAEAVAKTNEMMYRFTAAESFVTLCFGLLNTRTGGFRYVSAGHPPALVMSADGRLRRLEGANPIIGAYAEVAFAESQATLGRGERLILYSDGVTEARAPDGRFFGEEGLLAALERHRNAATTALSAAIMREVVDFSDGTLRDDAALLTLEPVKLRHRDDGNGPGG